MAGRQRFKDERAKHLEAIGAQPLPLPSERRNRPIPYSDDLPDEAVDLAASAGLSETEIAAHWAVDLETIRQWCEAHPELGAAMSRARTAAEAWWEEKARRALELRDNRFPAGAWAMVMKARFPNYRERVEVNHRVDITKRLVVIQRREPAELTDGQSRDDPKALNERRVVRLAPGLTAEGSTESPHILEGQATEIPDE